MLDEPLADEERILDAFVAGLAIGETTKEMFDQLHAAAVRDDRVANLGFAYERLPRDTRVRTLPKGRQAELWLYAASFFADVFGDEAAAVPYAERAVQIAPESTEAFDRLEALLVVTQDGVKLAKACSVAAGHRRDKAERLRLLRRAVELLEAFSGTEQEAIPLLQQIVQIEPTDRAARDGLEQMYLATRRGRDLAKLLEESLAALPAGAEADADQLRLRLVALYRGDLRDPQKAAPHVEALLERDHVDEQALQAAEALLDQRALVPKLAPKLSAVYARLGRPEDEATTLTLELKLARPPRLTEVHRRLAVLRQEVLQDPSGALELLEPLVSKDPTDDDLRRRYLDVSATFHRQVEAARLLTRAMQLVKEPPIRAKIGLEVARLYANEGEAKRAQSTLEQVISQADDDTTRLEAARLMVDLHDQMEDPKVLAQALEHIVRLDADLANRVPAAKRLAELCEKEIDDPARAIVAWKTLIHSPRADEALDRLEALSKELGDDEGLVEVLEQRAQRATSPEAARDLAFRAAELRTTKLSDVAAALAAWRTYVGRYGASREAHARLAPLLEKGGHHAELAQVLEREVALLPAEERAPVLVRLAQVRLRHLGDTRAALDAYRDALEASPSDKQSRRAVERMLAQPEQRERAADVLERVYRKENNHEGIVRVLLARADGAADAGRELAPLSAAADVVEGELRDARRGLGIAGRALRVAMAHDPELAAGWLERFQGFAADAGDPAARATLLVEALGDGAVDSAIRSALAKAAAEALVAAGDVAGGIDAYRRALAFEPASPELLGRIDELLREQGSPEERLALYRAALEQPAEPARRYDLMHAIARIQRVDLSDVAGAIAMWRRLISENPADQGAHAALVEAYEELGDREALVAELERGLANVKGPRRIETRLKVAEILTQDGETRRALAIYRELLQSAELESEALETIEQLADAEGEAELLRRAVEKRAAMQAEPDDQIRALERLGDVLLEHFDEHDEAVAAWRRGARLSQEVAADSERTRRLFERVMGIQPSDRESAEVLLTLYANAGAWAEAPSVFSVLMRAPEGFGSAVDRLIELAPRMQGAGAIEQLIAMADEALGQQGGESARRARELMTLEARVLSELPERRDDAAAIYRGLIETHERDEDAAAFEEFLEASGDPSARLDDWRWLYGWRAEKDVDAVSVLLRWGALEESAGDADRAARVYERVLELDAGQSEALVALCRLRRAAGDGEGLLKALVALRDGAAPGEHVAIDLQRADLLVTDLGRPNEALPLLRGVLEVAPNDAEAVRITRKALELPEVREAAAGLLEGVAASAEEPALAGAVLTALLSASQGVDALRDARARWYLRAVDLRESDPEAALSVAVLGAEELPHSGELWGQAERYSRKIKRPDVLAEAYRRVLDGTRDPSVAEEVGRRMVEFHEEWFDDAGVVLHTLERVLELSPLARWALDRVKLALNAEGRWEELFKLYDNAIARTADDSEREDLLDEAALAAKDLANDTPRAIRYFERLAAARPGDLRLESTLERLYDRQGETKKLIELIEKRLPTLKGRELARLRIRLAGLWLDIDTLEPAFALVEKLLGADAGEPRAYELLERVLDKAPVEPSRTRRRKGKKTPNTIAERTVALLVDRYRIEGKTRDLVRVLRAELRLVGVAKERLARLQAILELQEQSGDLPGAFQTAMDLVRLVPKDSAHREKLGQLAAETHGGRARVAVLSEVADESTDDKVRLEILGEAAAIAHEQLEDRSLAIELYQRVLGLAGGTPDVALSATRELEALLASAGRSEERCAVLETMAGVERDAERRRAALAEVAKIATEKLDDPERAIRAWRGRLQDDPTDLEALDGLDPLLERVARWPELAEVLDRRASLLEGDEARRDRVRLARLREQRLGDRPGAIDEWRRVRAAFGADEESFEALTTLLESETRWAELAELVAQAAADASGTAQRQELQRLLGDIHRDHTGEPMQAIRAYIEAGDWELARRVAGSVAEPEQARTVMAGLLDLAIRRWQEQGHEAQSPPARTAHWAIQSLVKRLLDDGAAARVVELQLRGASLPFELPERRQFSREAAWTACDRLEDPDRAIEILRELFEEDASDEVASASVARYARLLEEGNRPADLAAVWEQQALARSRAGDRAGAAALWARAAGIWENTLSNVERAIAVHRQGAAIGGEASLEALARLYVAQENDRGAAQSLEWLCAQSNRETLASRALSLAEVYVRLGERGRARACLEHAAATALDATAVRARLRDLYEQSRAWGPLANLLVDEAARATDTRKRLQRLREAAHLHLKERHDPHSAIALYEQAVELEPDDASLRLTLSQALAAAKRFEDAAAILRTQIERYGSRKPKDRALIHLHLARVSLAAGQRAEALSELDIASKIDPAQPAILYELSKLSLQENQLARAEKSYRALLLVLRRPEDSDDDVPGRAEVYLDLSEIASRQGDAERATEFIESAFEAALDSRSEARSLERALESQGRYDLLARAVESRLEVASHPADAARALADLVILHAEKIGAGDDVAERVNVRAERIHGELSREEESDQEAWGALSRVYEWLGKPEEEAKALERRVAAILEGTPTPEEAEPLYRLATIRMTEQAGYDEGVSLLSSALEASPDFERAQQLLEAAAERAPEHEGVLRLLESVARRAGREEALVDAIALSAAAAFTTAAKIREGAELGLSIGKRPAVVRMLGAALSRVEQLDPDDALWMYRRFGELSLLGGDAQGAADAKERAAAIAEPDVARGLLIEVARLAVDKLDDSARAEKIYRDMLSRDPADRDAWEPLLEVYRRRKARAELIELIEATVPLVESTSDRNRLRLEEATLMLEEAGRKNEAASLLEEIIDEAPEFHEAAETLTQLYEREERFDDLSELVERQLDVAKTNQDVTAVESMSLKLGGLLERQRRHEDALAVYRAILDWNDKSRVALRAIVALAEKTEIDEFEYADAIEALVSVEDRAEVAPLVDRLIGLRRAQGDEVALDRALDIGFSANPQNGALREQIVRRAGERGDHRRAALALRQAYEAGGGAERDLLVLALEAFGKAGKTDAALSLVEVALEKNAEDAELRYERARLLGLTGHADEALEELRRAHADSGRFMRPLIAALEAAAQRTDDAHVAEHTIELVDLLEKTGQTDKARHHLAQLLKVQPKHRDALRRLAWLASAESRWEEASAAYRRLIPLETGDALVSAAMNLADACERSERLADARGGLERAVQIAPDNADLRQRLRELYEVTEAHRELAHMLLDEAAAESKVSARTEILLQAANLLLEKNRAPDEAVRVLEEVQGLMPESVEGAVLLARAQVQLGQPEKAMAALQQVVSAYRGRRIRELSQVFQEMANIHLEEGDLSRALEALAKAFDMDMRNGELAMQLGYLALDLDEQEMAQRAFRAVTMMRAKQEGNAEGATTDAKAVAYYHLSRIAHAQGDVRKARLMASKAVSENPNHEDAQALLEELRAG